MTKQKNCLLALLSFCLISSISFGQQHNEVYDASISEKVKAYYEYLPENYPAPGVRYPLILFVHGFGELGPGTTGTLPWVLRNGLPRSIDQGQFPKRFTVNGQTFRFIVISPQFAGPGFPSVNDVNNMINYAIARYPVDINRIYLTGLSMGGGVTWYYSGYNSFFANRIAAIVPICGAVETDRQAQMNYANNIATANLPVWATHNRNDPTVEVGRTDSMVKFINTRSTPPNPLARKTIFEVGGHDAWTQTYDSSYKENNLNVYEWMLQYRRNFTVLPVNGLSFTAQQISNARRVQLRWSTEQEINIRGYKVLRSTDGVNFNQIAFINSSAVNGNGSAYAYIDESPFAGKDFYRLEIDEFDGDFTLSEIKSVDLDGYSDILISPNPVKETMNLQTGLVLKNATLQIFTSSGQQVFSKLINGSGNIAVKINTLPPGVYLVRITDRDMVRQLKFVKQ